MTTDDRRRTTKDERRIGIVAAISSGYKSSARVRDRLVSCFCGCSLLYLLGKAYYAIFYAANALLLTRGLSRSKHSGVIAAFRQHFVKPGHIEDEYGEIYGRVMDDRNLSDYDVESSIEPERARADLSDAQRFVERVTRYLDEGPGYEQASFSSPDAK